jgi:hypothetical protein
MKSFLSARNLLHASVSVGRLTVGLAINDRGLALLVRVGSTRWVVGGGRIT